MNSQFTFFRILFGSFLTWHFLALIPYGTELFSNEGLIGDASLNPTYGLFPNPLYIFDGPLAVFDIDFGRTPGGVQGINAGRDHYPYAWSALVDPSLPRY